MKKPSNRDSTGSILYFLKIDNSPPHVRWHSREKRFRYLDRWRRRANCPKQCGTPEWYNQYASCGLRAIKTYCWFYYSTILNRWNLNFVHFICHLVIIIWKSLVLFDIAPSFSANDPVSKTIDHRPDHIPHVDIFHSLFTCYFLYVPLKIHIRGATM